MAENEDADLLSALIDAFDSDDEMPLASPPPPKLESNKASPPPVQCKKESPTTSSSSPQRTNIKVKTEKPSNNETVHEKGLEESHDAATVESVKPAVKERPVSARRVLEDFDIFSPNDKSRLIAAKSKSTLSNQLFGDMGSDDEDDDMISKRSLNENGMEITKLMNARQQSTVTSSSFYDNKKSDSQIRNSWVKSSARTAHSIENSKSLSIPDIGLEVLNPKVSSDFLKTAMTGKDYVSLSNITKKSNEKDACWITYAVVASRTETKRSSSGKEYIILRLVDMLRVENEVTLFLFGAAYTKHWKTPVASLVGLMNPAFMKNGDSKGKSNCIATVSINDACQMLHVGTSKDFGTCGTITKQGNKCTNIINKSLCNKCKYHVMQEHKKYSKSRSELNSAFTTREPVRASIMNKMKGKRGGEDIFYGGQSFSTAAKPSKPKTNVNLTSMLVRSKQRGEAQSTLNLFNIRPEDHERLIAAKQAEKNKATKNLEDLIAKPSTSSMHFMKHLISKELKGTTGSESGIHVKSLSAAEMIAQEKAKSKRNDFFAAKKNKASENLVVLDSPATPQIRKGISKEEYTMMRAKMRIREKGGVKKEDVNSLKKNLSDRQKEGIKRKVEKSLNKSGSSSEDGDRKSGESTKESAEKRQKLNKIDVNSEEYKALRNRKSVNSHLIKKVTEDRETQYFNTLEKKEGYENKLLDTHWIDGVMFFCPQCDYQDWGVAERCKKENHSYRKLKVIKRFFKCNKCKDRMFTNERFPTTNCKKCGASSFSKAGMINEKKVTLAGQDLSLRGNEESRLGNYDSQINLDIN